MFQGVRHLFQRHSSASVANSTPMSAGRSPARRRVRRFAAAGVATLGASGAASLIGLLGFSGTPASAVTICQWTGDTTGGDGTSFSDANNWDCAHAPTTGDAVVFPAVADAVTSSLQDDLGPNVRLNSISFTGQDTTSSTDWTIQVANNSNSTLVLLAPSASNDAISVSGTASTPHVQVPITYQPSTGTTSGVSAASGKLLFLDSAQSQGSGQTLIAGDSGTGTVAFTAAANSASNSGLAPGSLEVSGGTLSFGTPSDLGYDGSSAPAVQVDDGTTLYDNSYSSGTLTFTNNITLGSNGNTPATLEIFGYFTPHTDEFSGLIHLNGDGTSTEKIVNAGTSEGLISGAIDETGSGATPLYTQTDAHTLTYSNSGNAQSSTEIGAGTVTATAEGAMGQLVSNSVTVDDGAELQINDSPAATWPNNITLGSTNGGSTLADPGTADTFSGTITGVGTINDVITAHGGAGVTISGLINSADVIDFYGNNTLSHATNTISAVVNHEGILIETGGGGFGLGQITVYDGAEVDFNDTGSSNANPIHLGTTLGGATLKTGTTGTKSFTGTITLTGANGNTIWGSSALIDVTGTGSVTGGPLFTKGSVELDNAADAPSSVEVVSGTLTNGGTGNALGAGTVTVDGSGTLNLNDSTGTPFGNSLVLGSGVAANGTATLKESNSTSSDSWTGTISIPNSNEVGDIWNAGTSGSFIVSGAISGHALQTDGSVTVSGNNSQSSTNVNTGTLTVNGANDPLGGTSVSVQSTATLVLSTAGHAFADSLTLAGGTLNEATGGTLDSWTGPVTLQSSTTSTITNSDNTLSFVLSGNMSGAGSLHTNGKVTLSGNNANTGDVQVVTGTLTAGGSNDGLGAGNTVTVNSSAELDLNAAHAFSNALVLGSGGTGTATLVEQNGSAADSWHGAVTLSSGTTDVITNTAGSYFLVYGTITGSGGLQTNGYVELEPSANNSFTGNLTVVTGTLDAYGCYNGLGSGNTVTVSDTTTLWIDEYCGVNFSNTLHLGTGTGGATLDVGDVNKTWSGPIALTGTAVSSTEEIFNSANLTVSGVISGARELIITGPGTTYLENNNSNSGGVLVSAGNAYAYYENSFGTSGDAVTVQNAGVLTTCAYTPNPLTLGASGTAATLDGAGDCGEWGGSVTLASNSTVTIENIYVDTGITGGGGTGTVTYDGDVYLYGDNTYSSPSAVDGYVYLAGGGKFDSSTLTVYGTLDNWGTVTPAMTVNGGTLEGTGTVGAVTVNNDGTVEGNPTLTGALVNDGGTVHPGNSPGTISSNSPVDLQHSNTGTFQVDITGSSPGSGYSVLDDSCASLNCVNLHSATLEVSDTFNTAFGTVFTIVNASGGAGTLTGTFSGLANGAQISTGTKVLRINYDYTAGTVTLTDITPVPPSGGGGGGTTPAAPDAPTGLTATAGNGQVALSWTAASTGGTPNDYEILRGTSSGGETVLTTVNAAGTSYTDTSVSNGTTYFYEVVAQNNTGDSAKSNEAHATPSGPPAPPAPQPTPAAQGYWVVGSDGGLYAFGNAGFHGSVPGVGVHVNNIVAMVGTPDRQGYWMVGSDGGVYAFGDAVFHGSVPGVGVHVNNIVGIAPTADGGGYWIIGSDGGVYAFGDAVFHGSVPGVGVHVNNVVGMAATPDGGGYWIVGSDGGLYAFGDAVFHGSVPGVGVHVNNVVGMAATPDGGGYWIVGSDGGLYSFGDAGFHGSVPGAIGHAPAQPVVGMAASPDGGGYWMVGADGGVYSFGDSSFQGSVPGAGVHVTNVKGMATDS